VVGGRILRGAAGHSVGSAAAALAPLGCRASGVSRLARIVLGHDTLLSATGAENLDGPGALVAEVSRLSTPPTQGGGRLLCWGWSSGWPAGRHLCGGGLRGLSVFPVGVSKKKTIDDVITRKQMTAWNFILY
jgi:hypothetical protein